MAEITATQIAMGHGRVDVGPITHEGRVGLLLHPRPEVIPVGEAGTLQNVDYWPQEGDVVIWLDGPERGETIIRELQALAQPAPMPTIIAPRELADCD